jgi:hypothetical protein
MKNVLWFFILFVIILVSILTNSMWVLIAGVLILLPLHLYLALKEPIE